jgi:hypothetical protein
MSRPARDPIRRLSRAALVPLAVLCACTDERKSPLEGEWRVQFVLETPGSADYNPAQRVLNGTIVVSRRLAHYYARAEIDSLAGSGYAYAPGRHYVDLRPFLLSADSLRRHPPRPIFHPDSLSDIFDEAAVWTAESDSVALFLKPNVTHIGLDMRGALRGGRVSGRWLYHAGISDFGVHGTFVMWRVRRSEAWDSAHARSRRGRARWDRAYEARHRLIT